jgi:hypothetical protein
MLAFASCLVDIDNDYADSLLFVRPAAPMRRLPLPGVLCDGVPTGPVKCWILAEVGLKTPEMRS